MDSSGNASGYVAKILVFMLLKRNSKEKEEDHAPNGNKFKTQRVS